MNFCLIGHKDTYFQWNIQVLGGKYFMIANSYLRYENFNYKKYLLGHSLAELVCNFVPDKKTKYYVYTITTHRNRAN